MPNNHYFWVSPCPTTISSLYLYRTSLRFFISLTLVSDKILNNIKINKKQKKRTFIVANIIFWRKRNCLRCQRLTLLSYCLSSFSAASVAFLSGGWSRKQTPGTGDSTPCEFLTLHFTLPELSYRVHCSSFSIDI